jgi:hypothetical protein
VHFVLELVQNADDNKYPPECLGGDATEQPALRFALRRNRLHVCNNETGFTETDVRAVCDVGKSSKKNRSGYIGNKGIGFKSVFPVADVAEIHSAPYRIKFDIRSSPIGYIYPRWIAGEETKEMKDATGVDWRTRICLHVRSQSRALLATQLNDLEPTLLLFLHRLRRLAVDLAETRREVTCMDRPHGVVELCVRDVRTSDRRETRWVSNEVTEELRAPQTLYTATDETKRVAAHNVRYAGVTVSPEFAAALGIRHALSVPEVLALLEAWSTSESGFRTTVRHMKAVYGFLYRQRHDGAAHEGCVRVPVPPEARRCGT